jgi:hypothetical protein
MKPIHWLIVILVVSLLTACTGSAIAEGPASFKTIEREAGGSLIGRQQYNALQPGLVVIASKTDLEEQDIWFSEEARGTLRNLDFQQNLAVAVFQGWKKSSGYEINITGVAWEGSTLFIEAEVVDLLPGTPASPNVTSPYHLVTLRKPTGSPFEPEVRLHIDGQEAAAYPQPTE